MACFEKLWKVTFVIEPEEAADPMPVATLGDGDAIKATPRPDFRFDHWSGSTFADARKAETTVKLTGDIRLTAHFVPTRTLTLVPEPLDGGRVEGGGPAVKDTMVTIRAVAGKDWSFERWEGPAEDKSKAETRTKLTEHVTIKAIFTRTSSALT